MLTRIILLDCLLLHVTILLAAEVVVPARYQFTYNLPHAEAITSAGVYDSQEHLVKNSLEHETC